MLTYLNLDRVESLFDAANALNRDDVVPVHAA